MFAEAHIHPMLVHFPIVFFCTLAVFDVVAMAAGADIFSRGPAANVSAGLAILAGIFALPTFYFGDVALDIAVRGGFPADLAEAHESLGSFAAIALGLWALVRAGLWWRNLRLTGIPAIVVPVVEVAGAVLVLVTAYYGGQLVYDFGVNVARAASGG